MDDSQLLRTQHAIGPVSLPSYQESQNRQTRLYLGGGSSAAHLALSRPVRSFPNPLADDIYQLQLAQSETAALALSRRPGTTLLTLARVQEVYAYTPLPESLQLDPSPKFLS
jgi:hypothetical protein